MATARDALLARNKRRYLTSKINVGTTEAPAYHRWQSLSELEKSDFEQKAKNKDGTPNKWARQNLRIRAIVIGAVNDEGHRIYTDADIPAMQQLDGLVIQALSDEAMIHIGWTASDVEQMAQMEQTIKNSPSPPVEGSP